MIPVFTVVIPSRFASTRLPGKPLLTIAGKPMVQHVWEQACKSSAQRVVVATDDARIVEACKGFGAEVLLTRADHESGTDRLAEVATQLGLASDAIVVNVQGDEPLIDPASINAAAELLQTRNDCSMSTLAHAIDQVADFANPNVVKVVLDARNTALYFSRAPIAWWRDGFAQGVTTLPSPAPLRHIGLYGYRVGFLREFPKLAQAPIEITESLEQLRAMWHGHRIAVHVTEHAPGPGVDTPEDLARVRALLSPAA